MNICSLKLVKALEFFGACVYATKIIIIKVYDDEEHSSRGIITLPINVGLVIIDTRCQVLDLEFPCNILIVQPWIHTLKAINSTYHEFLKFPFHDINITIVGDPNPFQYCTNLRGISKHQVPINYEDLTSTPSKYIDPSTLTKPPTSTALTSP